MSLLRSARQLFMRSRRRFSMIRCDMGARPDPVLTLPKRWCPRSQSKRRAPGRGRPQLGLQSRAPRLPQRNNQALLLGPLTRAGFLPPRTSASSSSWRRRSAASAQKLRLLHRGGRHMSRLSGGYARRLAAHRCSIFSRSACSQPVSM
ncbi:unnamed protein product, partial [Ixodes persulcatus]